MAQPRSAARPVSRRRRALAFVLVMAGAMASGSPWSLTSAADRRVSPVDPLDVPAAQATTAGLYISAADALALLRRESDVLLVDVRTRAEARRRGPVGAAAEIVPFLRPVGGTLVRNPSFVAGIRRAMAIRGFHYGATILLICDQAIQSAQAADDLALHGFPNVYSVLGGVVALRKAKAER